MQCTVWAVSSYLRSCVATIRTNYTATTPKYVRASEDEATGDDEQFAAVDENDGAQQAFEQSRELQGNDLLRKPRVLILRPTSGDMIAMSENEPSVRVRVRRGESSCRKNDASCKYTGNYKLKRVTDRTGDSVLVPKGGTYKAFVMHLKIDKPKGNESGAYYFDIEIGNSLFGRMSIRRNGKVSIPFVASTRKRVSDPALRALDEAVTTLLEGAGTISLNRNGILTFKDDSQGSLVLRKVD